jgi:hypothetical protein
LASGLEFFASQLAEQLGGSDFGDAWDGTK